MVEISIRGYIITETSVAEKVQSLFPWDIVDTDANTSQPENRHPSEKTADVPASSHPDHDLS